MKLGTLIALSLILAGCTPASKNAPGTKQTVVPTPNPTQNTQPQPANPTSTPTTGNIPPVGPSNDDGTHLDKNGVIRDGNGHVLAFSPELAAQDPCIVFHKRMATAREIASRAQSCGAKGLLEDSPANQAFVKQYNQDSRKKDTWSDDVYIETDSKDLNGADDNFFFNAKGFRDECNLVDANGEIYNFFEHAIVYIHQTNGHFYVSENGDGTFSYAGEDYNPGLTAGVWCVNP